MAYCHLESCHRLTGVTGSMENVGQVQEGYLPVLTGGGGGGGGGVSDVWSVGVASAKNSLRRVVQSSSDTLNGV